MLMLPTPRRYQNVRPVIALLFGLLCQTHFVGANPAPKADADSIPSGPLVQLGSDRFRAAGSVRSLAFSPDGSRLASFAENGLSIWDAETGAELRFVPWRYAYPQATTWPSKGQAFAVLNPANDGTFLWAFTDDKAILPPTALGDVFDRKDEPPTRYNHVALTIDGTRLATAKEELKNTTAIQLWEVQVGKHVDALKPLRSITLDKAGCSDFGFTPDGKTLVVFGVGDKANSTPLTLWDVETAKQQKKMLIPTPALHELGGRAFSLSTDGNLLALAREDMTSVLVSLTNDEKPKVFDRNRGVSEKKRILALSPDGKWLAVDQFGSVLVWDVVRAQQVRHLKQSQGLLATLVFSADSSRLASADHKGLIQVWKTGTWEPIAPPEGHTNTVIGLALSPDRMTAVTVGSDKTLRFWNAQNGKELQTVKLDKSPKTVHYTADGKRLFVSASGLNSTTFKFETSWLSADSDGRLRPVEGELSKILDDRVDLMGPTADGRTLLTWSGRRVSLRDWPSGKLRREIELSHNDFKAEELKCQSACLSVDERYVAVSLVREYTMDGMNHGGPVGSAVWDTVTGKSVATLNTPEVWYAHVAFMPNGKNVIVGGMGDTKREDEFSKERISLGLFDAATGKLNRRFQLPEGIKGFREVKAVAVCPDGRILATAEIDHSITVYEIATGRIRQQLFGHKSTIRQLTVAPHGLLLSATWNDPFAYIWGLNPIHHARLVQLTEANVEAEWARLAEPDARVAFRAMQRLAGDRSRTLTFIRQKVNPAKQPDAKALEMIFVNLEAKTAEEREQGADALNNIGRCAVEAAKTQLAKTTSEEVKQRLQLFLERQEKEELNSDELRSIRMVELLEAFGGDDARKLLKNFAKGTAAAWLTSESAAAFRRLQLQAN